MDPFAYRIGSQFNTGFKLNTTAKSRGFSVIKDEHMYIHKFKDGLSDHARLYSYPGVSKSS